VTLFTPITNWINVTIVSSVSANRSAAISFEEAFSVRLSTPVWSKLLFTWENDSSVPAGTLMALTTRYDVNVSSIVALASAIDNQLGYQSNSYTLTLDLFLSGSVGVPGEQQSMSFEPLVNFTFANSLITPSGLTYAFAGEMIAPSPASDSSGFVGTVPYWILAAALAGMAGSGWLASRREEPEALPPLRQLIEPYEEAIATTGTVPKTARSTEVPDFSDLVKIADTLGKPILRPTGGDPARPRLYVVDGETVYRYTYPIPPGAATLTGVPIPAEREGTKRPRSPRCLLRT
jgi:hypothetical protein